MDDKYKNNFPKVEVSKDSILNMLMTVTSFKMEERDLALDRFKKMNDDLLDVEEFWSQGKNAIEYLKAASNASNYLGDMAQEMMKYVFDNKSGTNGEEEGSVGLLNTSDDRYLMAEMADKKLKELRNIEAKAEDEE